MSKQAKRRGESEEERRDRNLLDLMQELRVAFPGVQIFFAFLLVVPFQSGWPEVSSFERNVYFATLLLTAASSVCFIAPAAHHRVRFREQDVEWLVVTGNRLMLLGLGFLAAAMVSGLLLIAQVVFDAVTGIVVSAATALAVATVWFGIPLWRRREVDFDGD